MNRQVMSVNPNTKYLFVKLISIILPKVGPANNVIAVAMVIVNAKSESFAPFILTNHMGKK